MPRCTPHCWRSWRWRGERLGGLGFYLVFALAITASVQLVGVYLVFASLILPALAVRGLSPRRALLAGWALGALAYAAGLAASAAARLAGRSRDRHRACRRLPRLVAATGRQR